MLPCANVLCWLLHAWWRLRTDGRNATRPNCQQAGWMNKARQYDEGMEEDAWGSHEANSVSPTHLNIKWKELFYRLKENSHSTHVNFFLRWMFGACVFSCSGNCINFLKMVFSSWGKEGNVAVQLTYPMKFVTESWSAMPIKQKGTSLCFHY